jgi:hypothetical protein
MIDIVFGKVVYNAIACLHITLFLSQAVGS